MFNGSIAAMGMLLRRLVVAAGRAHVTHGEKLVVKASMTCDEGCISLMCSFLLLVLEGGMTLLGIVAVYVAT